MGNCFSKTDKVSAVRQGRVLGTTPPKSSPTAPVPVTTKYTASNQPQTVGGPSGQAIGSPAAMAAKAAETRAQAANSKHKGVIGQKLNADRKQTMTGTLKAMSADELRRRDADAAAAARTHN